jgi:hypothetical protein
MTVEQQADLDCLTFAKALGSLPSESVARRDADAMVRVFTVRLVHSDAAREWASLAGDGSSVTYGWFMGQMDRCRDRLKRPLAGLPLSDDRVRASVWLDADQAQLLAKVEDGPRGYRLIVDCVRGCIPRTRYVQDVSDSPISLFRLWDGDDLLFSVWAGGSAYRVRVWKVSRGAVVELLEASSRGRPDISSAVDGAPTVRTYEADGGTQPTNAVTWEYRDGAFTRAKADR